MNEEKLYIFAGGASGGHLCPGLAVADALVGIDPGGQIMFVCSQRQIDQVILEPSGYQYERQPVRPLPGRPGAVWPFWRSWQGSVRMCRELMSQNRPVAVLGLGGFAAGPAMKVASQMGVPVAMLNPDAVAGKANRFCRRYADKIFVQWDVTARGFGKHKEKCIVSGCPVRKGFTPGNRQGQESKKTLVIVGGSLGGHNVNTAVVRCLGETKALLDDWRIVHLAGKQDRQWVEQQYAIMKIDAKVLEFSDRMDMILADADLVIARAGGSTLAELTAMGLPSILLPYPYHKDQHQRLNAQILEDAGAARIVIDDCDVDSTAGRLGQVMTQCCNGNVMAQMARAARAMGKPDAAQKVAENLMSLAEK